MKIPKSESAVSPVIGTILLVAITVVLVAIIAAVVMGMSGSNNHKEVGLTVAHATSYFGPGSYNGNPVALLSVIVYGGRDADKLRYLNVSVEGADGVVYFGTSSNFRGSDYYLPPENSISASSLIGQPLYYLPMPLAGTPEDPGDPRVKLYNDGALVVVTGTFSDGTSQILFQSKMTFPNDLRGYYFGPPYSWTIENGWQHSPTIT